MSSEDKASNKAEEFKGQAKEWVGEKTGDEDVRVEGVNDQAEANMKQAGEHVKDALHDAKDAATGRD